MKNCIFCPARANSNEHFWPKWALKHLPRERLQGFIGKSPIDFSGDYTIGCVCSSCNSGWMNDIEVANGPVLGKMMLDTPVRLDPVQRMAVAQWASIKAMVLDSATLKKQGGLFYTQEERDALRESKLPPRGTAVWLGRFLVPGREAHASGLRGRLGLTDRGGSLSPAHFQDAYRGHVTSILMGCVCLQVFSIHAPEKYRYGFVDVSPKAGPWDELLVGCWPIMSPHLFVDWPPVIAFTPSRSGPALTSIKTLHARWQIGIERDRL